MSSNKDTNAPLDPNVEQGRSELLPRGFERKPRAELLKESDLSDEDRAANAPPATDPLGGASEADIQKIRESMLAEAGEGQTLPITLDPKSDIEDHEDRSAKLAHRVILDGAADLDAIVAIEKDAAGNEVEITVREARARALRDQIPQAADAEDQDRLLSRPMSNAPAARITAMREMIAPAPSHEAIAGRVRPSGEAGGAILDRGRAAGSPARASGKDGVITGDAGVAGGAGTGGATGGEPPPNPSPQS